MKDDFDPRDLVFDKVKNLYEKQITGPSLKQIQEAKKITDN